MDPVISFFIGFFVGLLIYYLVTKFFIKSEKNEELEDPFKDMTDVNAVKARLEELKKTILDSQLAETSKSNKSKEDLIYILNSHIDKMTSIQKFYAEWIIKHDALAQPRSPAPSPST